MLSSIKASDALSSTPVMGSVFRGLAVWQSRQRSMITLFGALNTQSFETEGRGMKQNPKQ
jgi:hypothetical protein